MSNMAAVQGYPCVLSQPITGNFSQADDVFMETARFPKLSCMRSWDGSMPNEMGFIFSALFLNVHSSLFPLFSFKSHCTDLGNYYFPSSHSAFVSVT